MDFDPGSAARRMLQCGLLLAGCSSALLGAGCAGTSPGLSDTIEGSFIRAAQTWDLNHDGEVTCEEWRIYAASLFKDVDSDHCSSKSNCPNSSGKGCN